MRLSCAGGRQANRPTFALNGLRTSISIVAIPYVAFVWSVQRKVVLVHNLHLSIECGDAVRYGRRWVVLLP